jgi:hypothetical protein
MDTSAVELPEADAQRYVGTSEDDQALEEKVWEYDELVGYREVNGMAEVAVPWKVTWEPAREFPPDEVARSRRHGNGKEGLQVRRREVRDNVGREEGHHLA